MHQRQVTGCVTCGIIFSKVARSVSINKVYRTGNPCYDSELYSNKRIRKRKHPFLYALEEQAFVLHENLIVAKIFEFICSVNNSAL